MRNTNSMRAQQTRSADGYAEPARVGRAVYRSLLVFCALVFLWGMLHPIKAQAASKSKYKVSFGRKTLFEGEKQQIAATGKKVTYKYKSSNKSVLSVNKKGVLKAKKKGTAKITVTAYWKVKGKTRYKAKNYTVKIKKLKLKKKSVTLKSGEVTSVRFNQNIGSRTVVMTSSDSKVALPDGSYIKAIKPGNTNVTVKVGDYLTYTYAVKVSAKDLGTVSYKLLVNQTGINSFLDIKSLMRKEIGQEPISYDVSDPSKGEVVDGIYHVLNIGVNKVKVYGGGVVKTFSIDGRRWGAHRGYLDMRPENTIDAFITAGTSGAAMCETDLQVSSDGEIVCLHNATVNHMTDGTGSVHGKTLEELRQLKIDNGNGLDEANDKYIPTFEEYLRIMKRQHMIAIVELKEWRYFNDETEEGLQDRQAALKKVYQQICSSGMQNQCLIISFYAKQLKMFCEVNPDNNIPMGALRDYVYSEGATMDIPNFSMYKETRFGYYDGYDYSPILGRKNKSYQQY